MLKNDLENSSSSLINDDVWNTQNKTTILFGYPVDITLYIHTEDWNVDLRDGIIHENHLISDQIRLATGFEFQRALWTALNRIKYRMGNVQPFHA